eukprot:TRINITY_DN1602_c1_g2_i1.p1 TRINITY_DN1602_c1_g2~~TRINITY_DN1602_c1_g2_i1.p1  ORF type:complete len:333 (+),score=90.26 TRINITY_DN1602_c1_g2_i1:73-1071(+)
MRAALLLVAAVGAAADRQKFREWQRRFEVTYTSAEEEAVRYLLWQDTAARHGAQAEHHPHADRSAVELEDLAAAVQKDLGNGLLRAGAGDDPYGYPFTDLPASYVQKALASGGIDWREKSNCVTTPKNQGSHGYCGTFMRVAVAESQYALQPGNTPKNLSTEQLVDCAGWASDQRPMVIGQGLERWEDYPYVPGGYKNGTPPCTFDKTKVAAKGWTKFTHGGSSEDQLAAFMYKNGPVGTGINADIFYHVGDDNFVIRDECKNVSTTINHAITVVGFGSDKPHGDYWIIKNSWGSGWRDHGFVYLPRGIKCGNCCAGAQMWTIGDPAKYFSV